MKLLNKILSFDVYGKEITLNFNSKGNSHKTFVGGICTIISTLFFIMYCGQKIINASGNSDIDLDKRKVNIDNLGEVSLGSADYIPRYILEDWVKGPIPYDDEAKRYIHIEAV